LEVDGAWDLTGGKEGGKGERPLGIIITLIGEARNKGVCQDLRGRGEKNTDLIGD